MAEKVINVLVVESDVSAGEFVKQALSGCSNSVRFCAEGIGNLAEAVELLNQKSFDIVLLDIRLLDSEGADCVKQIRSLNPYMPFIVMTESADEEIGVRAIKNGADDYLVKGKIFKDVLRRSIRYAIERKKEQKRSEKALTDERNKAQKYLDVAQVIIVVLDADQKVTLINKKGCEILSRREDEIIGKDWCDNFIPEPQRDHVRAVISKVLQGGIEPVEYFENPVLTKSGHQRIIAWRSTVLSDRSGRIEAMLSSGEDITDRKDAERQSAGLLDEVESANRELKDFAYIVSHDLKAPLRGIKSLADWISTDYADKFDDEGKEQMNMLMARVDRMHNLIDGVLQYSRVGRIREKIVRIDLDELVPEVVDMVCPPESIEIEIENPLPVIECEKTRIMQVFQNLISNAVKYMDKPQGLIRIGCSEEDGCWKFSVSDNGPGIEPEHFDRIFQIFQTLSPRDEVESTGVGLAVVKKIMEFYNGKIWLESKPGQGSTFFFTLPRQERGIKNAQRQTSIACRG